MRVNQYLWVLLVTVISAGCSAGNDAGAPASIERTTTTVSAAETSANTWDETQRALDKNRALWGTTGSEAYEMRYVSTCGENGWVTDGELTIVVRGQDVTVVAGHEPFEVATVERLFETIEEAKTAARVDVTYGKFGQPVTIDIDFNTAAIDDEFCVDVSEFVLAE